MSKVSKLKKSRSAWKEKAVDRTGTIRYQRAELKRVKNERDKYKSDLRQTQQELKQERQKHSSPIKSKEDLNFISLRLFLIGHVGFKAISRMLGILQTCLGISKVPAPQTIMALRGLV